MNINMRTTFENIVAKLNQKGMVVDHPEQVPPTSRSPIPVHCRLHNHQFIWDTTFILKNLENSYDTYCPRCISTIIVEDDAKQLCKNLNIEFIKVSNDNNTYFYRLPSCGHEQSSPKKTLKNMTHQPYCSTCIYEKRSQQDPLEYPLLKKFYVKIQRYRKKSFDFTDKIPEILDHIYKRLTEMNIGMHQIGFDDDDNDLWIYMKCEGDDYCHRNTITLLEMINRLKYVNMGNIQSVCHECCEIK